MALYSRPELCAQLKISQAVISMAVKRGHLILTSDKKYIDDSEPVNALFIAKKGGGTGAPVEKAVETVQKPLQTDSFKPNPRPQHLHQQDKDALTQLKIEKETEAVARLKEERELIKIKKERLQGESVPVSQVQQLISVMSDSINEAWEKISSDRILEIQIKFKLKAADVAALRAKEHKAANDAKQRAVEAAKKKLRALQAEMSNSRGRGEHE